MTLRALIIGIDPTTLTDDEAKRIAESITKHIREVQELAQKRVETVDRLFNEFYESENIQYGLSLDLHRNPEEFKSMLGTFFTRGAMCGATVMSMERRELDALRVTPAEAMPSA